MLHGRGRTQRGPAAGGPAPGPCNVSWKVFHDVARPPTHRTRTVSRRTRSRPVQRFVKSVPRCCTTADAPNAGRLPADPLPARATFREKCSTMLHDHGGPEQIGSAHV